MRIGMLGINHKLAELKLRELFAKVCRTRFGPEACNARHHPSVLLSTCNRTEIYFSSPDLAATHSHVMSILKNDIPEEFDQKLYSFLEADCFQHLIRVTSGLDSAIVAETEIQGQVKDAYETAASIIPLPSELHFLFQKALKMGKTIRTHYPIRRGIPDLEHAILNLGHQHFTSCENRSLLFLGASDINRKILHFLMGKKLKNISIANRSDDTAMQWASDCGIRFLPWSQKEDWQTFDWVIVGTSAHHYLVTKPSAQPRTKLILDLCVPRNVDPLLTQVPGVTLMNIDELNVQLQVRREKLYASLAKAEQIVAQGARRLTTTFRKKQTQRWAFATEEIA